MRRRGRGHSSVVVVRQAASRITIGELASLERVVKIELIGYLRTRVGFLLLLTYAHVKYVAVERVTIEASRLVSAVEINSRYLRVFI